MTGLRQFQLLALFSAALAMGACSGPTEVASPGEGNFGGGPLPPPPPPPPPPPGGAPDTCPTGFANVGTVAGGSLRNCQIPNLITGNFTIPQVDNVVYSLSNRTDVGVDRGGDALNPVGQQGILTIEPGVTIFGSSGADFLVVNRGSQIFAVGEEDNPIVMTSKQSVEGTTTIDSIGQWGGLVILGRANITNCPGATPAAIYGTPACQAIVEGTNALYGGNNNADNSGSLQYFRVMHSGFEVVTDVELNGITLAGVGAGTIIDHVQVHNSSDDGIEWFGGTVNAKHLVFTGIDDDSMDTDNGFDGAIQFVLTVQRETRGDHAIEASMAALAAAAGFPERVSNPALGNFTFVGRVGTNGDGDIHLNTGTQFRLYNGVVTRSNICVDIDQPDTSGTNAIFRSVFLSCPTSFDPDVDGAGPEEATIFTASGDPNNVAGGVSTLTDTFVNGGNEDGVVAVDYTTLADAEMTPAQKSFMEVVDYIGAVEDASDDWWDGWTCGLTAADPC